MYIMFWHRNPGKQPLGRSSRCWKGTIKIIGKQVVLVGKYMELGQTHIILWECSTSGVMPPDSSVMVLVSNSYLCPLVNSVREQQSITGPYTSHTIYIKIYIYRVFHDFRA